LGAEYRIDTSENIIYEIYKGSVTVEEVIAMISKEHADTLYKFGMPTVVDLSEIHAVWDYLEMVRFSGFIGTLYAGSTQRVKWAIVSPPPSEKGILKVLDIMNDVAGINVETRFFENRKEALNWVKA
jgi:hypothetical protein